MKHVTCSLLQDELSTDKCLMELKKEFGDCDITDDAMNDKGNYHNDTGKISYQKIGGWSMWSRGPNLTRGTFFDLRNYLIL
jgi:hypothetical protein